MKGNPNAAVAGGTTGIAALIIWAAGLAHLTVPAAIAVLAGGAFTTLVLYIGRDGITGIARTIWNGSRSSTKKPPA